VNLQGGASEPSPSTLLVDPISILVVRRSFSDFDSILPTENEAPTNNLARLEQ
jgi:hypothetical protein